MTAPGQDAASRLSWAARRFWPVLLGGVALFAVLGVLVQPAAGRVGPTYEATTLIAAANLEIRPEQLARTTSTIFRSGDVARGTASALGLPDPDELVPEVIDIQPVEDTVLVGVLGRDPDPARAAVLADAAAEVLLRELNALGEGFGSFVEVSAASVPGDPLPAPSRTGTVMVTAVAGLVFAAGLVGLLLALRRPVLTGMEAAALSGSPLIGQLTLPAGRAVPPLTSIGGLSAMVRAVLPDRRGSAVFVSVEGDAGQRSRVAVLFARVLARTTPVAFVAHRTVKGITPDGERNIAVTDASRGIAHLDDLPVIIDGLSAAGMDVPQFLPAAARVVLVIPEGAPERSVRQAAGQFLDGELAGVVYVARGRRPSAPDEGEEDPS